MEITVVGAGAVGATCADNIARTLAAARAVLFSPILQQYKDCHQALVPSPG